MLSCGYLWINLIGDITKNKDGSLSGVYSEYPQLTKVGKVEVKDGKQVFSEEEAMLPSILMPMEPISQQFPRRHPLWFCPCGTREKYMNCHGKNMPL